MPSEMRWGLRVVADDLDLDRLADAQRVARVVDPAPGDIGDVQQTVDAAEIHESAVIGDVLDDPLKDLAFLEIGEELVARFGAGFLQHRAPRDDDVAAAPVHLEDLERLRGAHQRRDVAHRADIDLAAGEKRHRAREIDRETALDPAEDRAAHALVGVERLLKQGPRLFAARPFAGQHGLAVAVLHAFEIDVDRVAHLQLRLPAGSPELLQRDPSLRLESDIDKRRVVLDADDDSLDHGALGGFAFGEALLEHACEILSRHRFGGHVRRLGFGGCFVRHGRSCLVRPLFKCSKTQNRRRPEHDARGAVFRATLLLGRRPRVEVRQRLPEHLVRIHGRGVDHESVLGRRQRRRGATPIPGVARFHITQNCGVYTA